MKTEDFLAFTPRLNTPLVISFVEHMRSLGYSSVIRFDFWDFSLFQDEDDPICVVKTARNTVTDPMLERLTLDEVPIKVILLDGPEPKWENLKKKTPFLSLIGAGVFVRDVGWVTLPGKGVESDIEDLRFKISGKWHRNNAGEWRKRCTSCHVPKGPEEYYDSAYPTARDPKRNICKECMKRKDAERRAAKEAA